MTYMLATPNISSSNTNKGTTMAYATRDFCKVSDDIAGYEAQQVMNEIYAEQVQEKFDDLADGDYSPYLLENVIECLSEFEGHTELQAVLNDQDEEMVGTIILNLSHTYWTNRAKERAEELVRKENERAREDEELARCYDY